MSKDYYKTLGINKSASAEEIKKAYRKMAMKYHPDRGGDQEKFKEINEAYQVLSNPQKKSQYDRFGSTFNGAGQGAGGFGGFGGRQGSYYSQNVNFEDIFGSGGQSGGFGFMGDIFENVFGAQFAQVNVEVEIGLTQAMLGDEVKFRTQQGDVIEMKIPSGTRSGQVFRFRGKGLKYKQGRGDLNVTVKVRLPRRLNRKQRELFEELKKTGL